MIGTQIEVRIEELSIDPLQRQSSFSSVTDDIQNGFGILHCASLLVLMSGYLFSFAVGTAFPSPDYYENSVAMGLAPVRRSRAWLVRYAERGLGSPLIP